MLFEITYLYLIYLGIGRGLVQGNLTTSNSLTFHKKLVNGCGPERLGPGWTDTSDASCALNCLAWHPHTCYSFMYNYSTKLCTPGSTISPFKSPNSVREGDLYVREHCGTYLNFSKRAHNMTSAFVAYFPHNLTYFQASTACQCLDSHLYVMKSMDKYVILSQLVDQQKYTWIGLDDLKDEGRFVWSDDGQELDNVMLRTMFHRGQPDDYGANQDCVIVSLAKEKFLLDDANCKTRLSFACEKKNIEC